MTPEIKVFGDKRYLRNRWEHYKKDANKNAKILRSRGFKVRITEEAGGYRLWTCSSETIGFQKGLSSE